ncbi:MAG: DUF2157 domain-containing protein [Hyphomicrobiaceae bacterium]|nr:DUF2157 domain-containing protein [Hyphomicrobiaceae bacterium]
MASRKREIARWREAGWITPEGERNILADISGGPGRISVAIGNVFAVIAAALLGLAALTFVASNWQEMSRLARLALLLGTMISAYVAAGVLFERGLAALGHAAVLLGVLIFGASIMLISQMYHIDGHPPDLALLWGLGALAAGLALRSAPSLFAALLLAGIWSVWESGIMIGNGSWWSGSGRRSAVHWPFVIALAAIAAAFYRERVRYGLELCALAFATWILSFGIFMSGGKIIVVAAGIAAVAATASLKHYLKTNAALPGPIDWHSIARNGLFYGVLVLAGGIFMEMLTTEIDYPKARPSRSVLAVLETITWHAAQLIVAAAAIWYGLKSDHPALSRLGYTILSVTVLIIFFRTIGSLLGTSGFFLGAGLVAIGLAYAGYRFSGYGKPTSQAAGSGDAP